MKSEIKYIELKSGYADNGPAWIARVTFSKTGQTIYFNGKTLKKGIYISGNYRDIETGDEYWVSGVKKNGMDRHWAGSGKVMIHQDTVEEYLDITNAKSINSSKFEIIKDY